MSDLSSLRNEILQLARGSVVSEHVLDVSIEPSDIGEGGDFLRVQFEMRDLDSINPEEVEPLLRAIEDTVAEQDERFPSVRFAEAA